MQIVLLADGRVGLEITRWLIANYNDDVGIVVTAQDNEIAAIARGAGVRTTVFNSAETICRLARDEGLNFELGILAWWPHIIKDPLLTLPKRGFINTHPSLLPHARGKNYNFWTIVEEAPFGVSLHMVDKGVDSGDIVAQVEIPYSWEDTGGSLHGKALAAMEQLFKDSYPKIRKLEVDPVPQNLGTGSMHRAAELEPASVISLDKNYTARKLLNLLRARTFPGYPACVFSTERGEQFEVRVEIRRRRS